MNIETILSRPSVRGLEFRLSIEEFAHKVGKSLQLDRVRVLWRHDVQTAGINDHGDLYLSGVLDEAVVNRALVLKYAGYVVHELLHHKYTNFGVYSDVAYIKTLHNAVEDGWIENSGIASGLLGNIGPLLGEMIDSMTREAIATVADWNDAHQYPYILAVHCRAHATIKCPTNPKLAPIFDEAAKRCRKAKSSADTLKIAEWVYDQIKQESQKPSKSKPKDDKPEEKAGKDASGKGQDGPTGHDLPKGEGKDAPPKDQAPEGPVETPTDKVPMGVEPQLESGGLHGNYSKDTALRGAQEAFRDTPIEGLTDLPIPAKLRYEVKRLFDNSGLSEFSRNRKAGSINVHALPTVGAGNDRVFKRRLDVAGVDSAVVILLDVSGSMFDKRTQRDGQDKNRIASAVMTSRALLDTLAAAGVDSAVIAFGSMIYPIKTFGTNHRKVNAQMGNLCSLGGTSDYTALRYAHELLARRSESRKLVFVITDGRGQPDAVRQQITSGKALGVTTIGIGINSDVSDIYGNAVCVDNVADLGNVSFKQIKLAA
jgi:uncharacterized protein YegL